ncbi:MAG: hypothetical protein KGM47_14530 [Acidobacteriota bacterium]|nr:hypothetical protein [Acidobacteriota bacterium]
MKKLLLSLTILSLLLFLGGISVFAQPALQAGAAPQSTPSAAPAAKHHAHAAHKAAGVNYTAKYASGVQSLSGTISMVDAGQKVVVVADSDGTPFNFQVNKATKIEVGGKKGTLDELSDQTSKQVAVKYRDRLNAGLVASSIDVSE